MPYTEFRKNYCKYGTGKGGCDVDGLVLYVIWGDIGIPCNFLVSDLDCTSIVSVHP
jgi:hypothetical protein